MKTHAEVLATAYNATRTMIQSAIPRSLPRDAEEAQYVAQNTAAYIAGVLSAGLTGYAMLAGGFQGFAASLSGLLSVALEDARQHNPRMPHVSVIVTEKA